MTSRLRRRIGGGLSMGGMVGQWLGANAPERFGKIILANTACYYPDPTNWLNRIKAVKEGGIAAVADAVISGLADGGFSRTRAADHSEYEGDAAGLARRGLSGLLRSALPRSTSANCCQRSKARPW